MSSGRGRLWPFPARLYSACMLSDKVAFSKLFENAKQNVMQCLAVSDSVIAVHECHSDVCSFVKSLKEVGYYDGGQYCFPGPRNARAEQCLTRRAAPVSISVTLKKPVASAWLPPRYLVVLLSSMIDWRQPFENFPAIFQCRLNSLVLLNGIHPYMKLDMAAFSRRKSALDMCQVTIEVRRMRREES
jgi:hypothetical protein